MVKVLLAGESWVSDIVDHKGFDQFPHTQVHIGCAKLLECLRKAGHEVTHMRSHDVAVEFPLRKRNSMSMTSSFCRMLELIPSFSRRKFSKRESVFRIDSLSFVTG